MHRQQFNHSHAELLQVERDEGRGVLVRAHADDDGVHLVEAERLHHVLLRRVGENRLRAVRLDVLDRLVVEIDGPRDRGTRRPGAVGVVVLLVA